MKIGDWIFITIFVLAIIMAGFTSQQNVRLKQEREELKNEIQELNREIGEYEAMDSFWEDYIDLLDEIYQGKINEAVLQERVKWLEQEEATLSDEEVIDILDQLDFYLLEIVARRTVEGGYEYQVKEVGNDWVSEEWFFNSNLFSVGEQVLCVADDELILYDFEN